MSWIDQYVKPGMTAVDVGANVGDITKQLCAAVGETGTVVAIEPQAGLHTAISDKAPRARRLQYAVSDQDGWQPLFLSEQSVHASLYRPNLVVDTHQSEGVPVRTLDSLQASGELPTPVHAIKVDSQGAETAIVRGARQLLLRDAPVLFLEIWPVGLLAAGSSLDDLCDDLAALGYAPRGRTWPEVRALAIGAQPYGSDDVLFVRTA